MYNRSVQLVHQASLDMDGAKTYKSIQEQEEYLSKKRLAAKDDRTDKEHKKATLEKIIQLQRDKIRQLEADWEETERSIWKEEQSLQEAKIQLFSSRWCIVNLLRFLLM